MFFAIFFASSAIFWILTLLNIKSEDFKISSSDKMFFFSSSLYLSKEELISVGTLNSSLVHPREIFKSPIKESANAIILVHNHPSGDVEPSKADEHIANRFNESGKLLKIKVKDHLIIGKDSYYSFREKLKLI